MADKLLLSDGVSHLDLSDGASDLLIGGGAADQNLTVGFIASTAIVYAPTLSPGSVDLTIAFIPSGAIVYAPTLSPGAVAGEVSFIASTAQVFTPTLESETTLHGRRHRGSRMVKLRLIEEERAREEAARVSHETPAAPAQDVQPGLDPGPDPATMARARVSDLRARALAQALDLSVAADLAAQMALLDWLQIAADIERAAAVRAQAEAVLALKIGIEAVNDKIAAEIARQTALADAVLEELALAEQMVAAQMQAIRDDEEDAMALLLMAA